ncbi:hypothetical protein CSAL01_13204 [Colletotrichum salicis]|uniref:Uncharacterized protein n=1 Tax=Colletotrichum salicis TaxID=1209931 RepID=A0A135V3J9_9PEZI|nr:hypothetical protein CSAL01_13204 [Colletotrichum salicis]
MCAFACSRDWCPPDACQRVDTSDDEDDDKGPEIDPEYACKDEDITYDKDYSGRVSEYMRWFLMEPEYAATTGRQYITIVNLTPHNFKLTSAQSYQIDEFDWGHIPPGKARQNVAHYTEDVKANPVDDNGEAYYEIEGTNKKFVVRATTHIPDTYPKRVVFDLSGMGKGQREYKVPEQEVPVTLVITSSDSFGFITSLSHGPGNWMRGIKDQIKHRKLVDMLNIYDQLRAGSRWFDMRVSSVHQVVDCCGNYEFWTSHLTNEAADASRGRSGEKFDEVIQEINKLTNENPGEDRNDTSEGIYKKDSMSWTDAWPEKEDTKQMAEKAITAWEGKLDNHVHVAQWLCIPKPLTSTFVHSLLSIAVLPTNPALYWRGVNEIKPENFPNVLMVDYTGMVLMNEAGWNALSAELYTLAIGLNLYIVSENCKINPMRNPLLPPRKSGRKIPNPLVSQFNGIIFANGTIMDNPPPTYHPGRVEFLRNGTVFSSGTVLEETVPNPDFNSTSF